MVAYTDKVLVVNDASEPRMINNIMIYDGGVNADWCDHLIEKYEMSVSSQFKADVPSLDGSDVEVVDLTKLYVALEGMDWQKEKEEMALLMSDAYKAYRYELQPILSIGIPETEYQIELPTIKKYKMGTTEHIGPHSDTYMRGWEDTNTVKLWKGDRFLNILFYLNDVEEGGETEFYFNDCTIRVPARKGRLVVFPPLWTHIHAGKSPVSGDKYICNGHLRASITEKTFKPTTKGY